LGERTIERHPQINLGVLGVLAVFSRMGVAALKVAPREQAQAAPQARARAGTPPTEGPPERELQRAPGLRAQLLQGPREPGLELQALAALLTPGSAEAT